MAPFTASPANEESADEAHAHTTRVPTRYLGGTPQTHARHSAGLSGALPHVPRSATICNDASGTANVATERATIRRRRLLAIFGRMMNRFYQSHERKWSMGRWNCQLCQQRIVAWAWMPQAIAGAAEALVIVTNAMHESCANSSMWDVVLHHELLARAGYAHDVNALQFTQTPG